MWAHWRIDRYISAQTGIDMFIGGFGRLLVCFSGFSIQPGSPDVMALSRDNWDEN
jgi:hypothetical protein